MHFATEQVSEAARLTGRTWATSKKDLDKLPRKGVLTFEPGKFIHDPKATYKLMKTAEQLNLPQTNGRS